MYEELKSFKELNMKLMEKLQSLSMAMNPSTEIVFDGAVHTVNLGGLFNSSKSFTSVLKHNPACCGS